MPAAPTPVPARQRWCPMIFHQVAPAIVVNSFRCPAFRPSSMRSVTETSSSKSARPLVTGPRQPDDHHGAKSCWCAERVTIRLERVIPNQNRLDARPGRFGAGVTGVDDRAHPLAVVN